MGRAAGGAAARAPAAAAQRRHLGAAPACFAGRRGGGPQAARVRRAAGAAARAPAARPGQSRRRGAALSAAGALVARYREALPFTLTAGQESTIADIDADLARTRPMDRLLQGDVGSGKTVVALDALLRAVENGRQGALMAPTETLAEQHFLTVEGLCAPLGVRAGAADQLGQRRRARRRAGGARRGRGADRRRHARADPGAGRFRRPGRRRGRRAAPLRGRAAPRARRGPRAAPAPHDGDADPAHARAHRLRRPFCQRDREAAGRPQADRHRLGDPGPLARGVHAAAPPPRRRPPGLRRLPADRGVGDAASRGRPSRKPSGSSAASCAATASACCTAACGRPIAAS